MHQLTLLMLVSLQEALEQKNERAVQVLIRNGAQPDVRLENGQTPLQYAAALGAEACVRALLQLGASPDLSYTGLKPLGQAAVQGHANCLKLLLDGGASAKPMGPRNAMEMAARAGHAECVRLLLEVGTTEDYLYQALKSAVTNGHMDCAAMLATECTMMLEPDADLAEVLKRCL